MNSTDILVQEAQSSISTWTHSYYLWISLFYLMCVAVIIFPAIVALEIAAFRGTTNRVLAGLTAAIGAVMAWANLGVVAANFDNARSDLRLALIQYDLDHDKTKLLTAYRKDEALVRQNTPILPNEPATSPNK